MGKIYWYLHAFYLHFRPALHLFGHVHECHNIISQNGVVFSNAAMDIVHRANVIDLYYLQPRTDNTDDAVVPTKSAKPEKPSLLKRLTKKFRK